MGRLQLCSCENDAFELDRAFLQHYDALVAYGRRIGRGLNRDAEEFVHEAYLRSRRSWSGARRSKVQPEAYFYRSLRWAVADATRSRKRMNNLECADYLACFCSQPERDVVVREAIETALSSADRGLLLRVIAGETPSRLCRELRVSASALAVRISRARKKLERFLLGVER